MRNFTATPIRKKLIGSRTHTLSFIRIRILSIAILLLLIFADSIVIVNADTPVSMKALEYLKGEFDRFHEQFDVYTDSCAAGNHFVLPAKMGEDVEIKLDYYSDPHDGTTCIENKFTGTGLSWGGWYLMNGVLQGDETQPKPNWGTYPDAGFNLTGATTLTFYAKGMNGGERVEFFAFGIGRNAYTGEIIAPFPDSSKKNSTGYLTLTNEWKQYPINLTGLDLSYVLGGFGWATNASLNNNEPITFYLDDIQYDKDRLNEPRFLVSYKLLPNDEPVLTNTAFTYDNALALLAFLSSKKQEYLDCARLIGDAMVYAIDHDRYFTDGRLRNTYQGGDLKLFPGWTPNGKTNTARMSGWWDSEENWYEDKMFVGTDTGNMAWSIIALLSLYEETFNPTYLDASIGLGQWIENNTRDTRGAGGYTGGYEGWEQTIHNPQGQTKLMWKSTEHNIDCYVAFSRLFNLTGNSAWNERALCAKNFVEAMWDNSEGHFWTGTLEDGVTLNESNIPADVHAWGLMALDDTLKYRQGVDWVEDYCYVEADGFKGFDFNNDRDGIWFEGTAHMAVAYQIIENKTAADLFLSELGKAQETADNTDGKGLVAASHDEVSTGFSWNYSARLHVGATAWLVFAELGYNPYWNVYINSLEQTEYEFLIVRGSNDMIYYRPYNSNEETWGNWIALPGSTCDSPASVVYEDKLYFVVRGMDGNSLWFGSVNLVTDSFSGWSWISGATPSMPRLASNEDSLILIVRGTDNRIYHRIYDLDAESWGSWNVVPTGSTIDTPAVNVDGDYLHLVVRGMDDGLYHQRVYLPTLTYLGWSWIDGTTPSAPTLVSNYRSEGDDHLLCLMVRGSDNGIYLRSYDGGWSSWSSLPGATNDAVGACIQPSNPNPDARLQVVVRGMTGGLYHGKYDLNSDSFLGWTWISGETPSPPKLTS